MPLLAVPYPLHGEEMRHCEARLTRDKAANHDTSEQDGYGEDASSTLESGSEALHTLTLRVPEQ
jgi:hypothetical protein